MMQRRPRELRNGKLADEEIPVGMAGPFHIPRVCQLKRQPDFARNKLICDGTVVDAPNRNKAPASVAVMQLVSNCLQVANIHHRDAQPGRSHLKVGLVFWCSGSSSVSTTFSGSWPAMIVLAKSAQYSSSSMLPRKTLRSLSNPKTSR